MFWPGAISLSSSQTLISPSLFRKAASSRTKGLSLLEWLRKTETMAKRAVPKSLDS
jgi:hypothetical protein